MKLLLWDCKFVRFKDIKPSSRPEGIKQFSKEKTEGEFSNTLLAFVCIERDDTELTIQKAVKEILKMLDMLRSPRDVTVVPFAHLSSNIASPLKSVSLIEELIKYLERFDLNVHRVSFGYHKEFELHFQARGHPGSVAFREIK
jgi:threonyl-tRNA synthetase